MIGTRICMAALLALVALKLVWSGLHGKTDGALALGIVGILVPLLPALAAAAFRLRGFWVYAGFAPMWFFCHGVMELMAGNHLLLASIEVMLSLLFFGGYWLRTKSIKQAKAAASG